MLTNPTYTLAQAARLLIVPEPEALRLIASWGLRGQTVDGQLVFPAAQIEAHARQHWARQDANKRAQSEPRPSAKPNDMDSLGSDSSVFDPLPPQEIADGLAHLRAEAERISRKNRIQKKDP